MTREELDRLAEQPPIGAWTMNSGCTDYACECHGKVPVLVAEIRTLAARLEAMAEAARPFAALLSITDGRMADEWPLFDAMSDSTSSEVYMVRVGHLRRLAALTGATP
jgi:hypothetical protein